MRPLTFGGSRTITVPGGDKALSDAVTLNVAPEQALAVSLYAPEPTGPPTTHPSAFTTSYVSDGDHASHHHGNDFSETVQNWFFLEGVDVDRSAREGAVA